MRRALVAVAVALVATGIARPSLAGRALTMLVVVVATAVVVALVDQRWGHLQATDVRPFIPDEPPAPSGTVTPEIADLQRALDRPPGDPLPTSVARRVAESARGRLLDEHHLDPHLTADHDALRRLVGPDLLAVITAPPDEPTRVPVRRLPDMLDEVERL